MAAFFGWQFGEGGLAVLDSPDLNGTLTIVDKLFAFGEGLGGQHVDGDHRRGAARCDEVAGVLRRCKVAGQRGEQQRTPIRKLGDEARGLRPLMDLDDWCPARPICLILIIIVKKGNCK